jgi:hypothetical protein
MSATTTTTPRHELKFWITDASWALLLKEMDGLIEPDRHGAKPEDPSYTVNSLYLDTEELHYLDDKLEGLKERKKVRLRRYGRLRHGFVEVKAKHGRRIQKHRVDLTEEELTAVTMGDLTPIKQAHVGGVPGAGPLLAEFALLDLVPAVITRYERTAFMFTDDPGLRVTLDRKLSCLGKDLRKNFLREDIDTMPMLEPEVQGPGILEVKCSGPIPGDVGRFLRRIGVERKSISKYCLAVFRSVPLAASMRMRRPLGFSRPSEQT